LPLSPPAAQGRTDAKTVAQSQLIADGALVTAIPCPLVHFALRRQLISGLTIAS
jgi:ABC-type glycerol-3-phosphate transport system permease component